MAKFLEYVPGESFLHRMNPCVKLIGAVLIAIAWLRDEQSWCFC